MRVSGLTNETLSTMISNSHGNYAGVHEALCECAQEMVDKYRKKQETPENMSKLAVKTCAAIILFHELSNVSKGADADAIHKALSSALERHAKELQGYEHLISEKSSNYALVKQTEGLRQQAGAHASLLRYHRLKNKFLGPGSPLNDKEKKVVSALDKNKGLTLEILEAMDAWPDSTSRVLAKLYYEAGLLDSGLFTEVVKHENPDDVADAILFLVEKKLDTADTYSAVIKHRKPYDVAWGIFELDSHQLLTARNLDKISRQEDPLNIASAMHILNKEGLLEEDLCAGVFKIKHHIGAALAMVELKKAGLFRQDMWRTLVLEHEYPNFAALVITCLNDCGLLMDEYLDYVFKHEQFKSIVNIFSILEKLLRTRGNVYAVINHPDVVALESRLMCHMNAVRESGGLDQIGFEACLAKTGYVKKT